MRHGLWFLRVPVELVLPVGKDDSFILRTSLSLNARPSLRHASVLKHTITLCGGTQEELNSKWRFEAICESSNPYHVNKWLKPAKELLDDPAILAGRWKDSWLRSHVAWLSKRGWRRDSAVYVWAAGSEVLESSELWVVTSGVFRKAVLMNAF